MKRLKMRCTRRKTLQRKRMVRLRWCRPIKMEGKRRRRNQLCWSCLHSVCATCQPLLPTCPCCRLAYPAWGHRRRHRFLETAATRLAALRARREGLV
jgi:hypothetical protein